MNAEGKFALCGIALMIFILFQVVQLFADDMDEELKKWKNRYEQGLISKEIYEEKVREIVGLKDVKKPPSPSQSQPPVTSNKVAQLSEKELQELVKEAIDVSHAHCDVKARTPKNLTSGSWNENEHYCSEEERWTVISTRLQSAPAECQQGNMDACQFLAQLRQLFSASGKIRIPRLPLTDDEVQWRAEGGLKNTQKTCEGAKDSIARWGYAHEFQRAIDLFCPQVSEGRADVLAIRRCRESHDPEACQRMEELRVQLTNGSERNEDEQEPNTGSASTPVPSGGDCFSKCEIHRTRLGNCGRECTFMNPYQEGGSTRLLACNQRTAWCQEDSERSLNLCLDGCKKVEMIR